MPLAEDARAVSLLLQQLRDREVLVTDVAGAARSLEGPGAPSRATHDLSGIQPVAGRRANGRRAVRVREADSVRCQSVDSRSLVGGLGVVAGEVAVTEVVRVNEDDVRKLLAQ